MLHPDYARALTSREIAKVISGLLGSFAEFCEPSEICDAMSHFHDYADRYRDAWVEIHQRRSATR